MIDPHSDELYEELRRKLADYGSQPSEEVWANIRQRVPAAPAPALRPRRRIRRAAWAASLLFLLVSGVLVARYYQGKQLGWGHDVVANHSGKSAILRSSASARSSAAAPTTPNFPSPSEASTSSSSVSKRTAAASTASSSALARSDVRASVGAKTRASAAATSDLALRRRAQRAARPNLALADNSRKQVLAANRPNQATNGSRTAQSISEASTSLPGSGIQRETIVAGTSASQSPAAIDSQGQNLALSSQALPAAAGLSLLSPLPIAVALPSLQAPLVVPVPTETVAPPPPPILAARRLAVQLLAGPAISYRHLGRRGTDSLAREVEELERPAESYSAELGLTYALTPRLTLLTGLGYTEYATRLDLTVKKPVVVYASFQRPVLFYTNGIFNTLYIPDSVASGSDEAQQRVRHRDVYRFVTVPVQVQYQLGTAGRISYGVALGATANLYLGGRTAQASGCGCEQETWKLSDRPFRLVSVGLTAGTTISYQLAARWHLNLQPTFTYLITPLAQDQTRSARHLLSAGMRTGVTFDLR